MRLRDLSSSVPIWPPVPTPGVPSLQRSPPVRAAAKKSRALADTPDGATGAVSTSGAVPIRLSGAKSWSGSEGRAGFSCLAMVRLPLIIRPMVWSSRALATASAAMLPPAPTLLSTITGWPRALGRGSANRRAGRAGAWEGGWGNGGAVRSGDEPAGKPTMIFRGWFGHAGGAAPWAPQQAALAHATSHSQECRQTTPDIGSPSIFG